MIAKIIFTVICILIVAIIIHAAQCMDNEELAAWMGDDDYCEDIDAE